MANYDTLKFFSKGAVCKKSVVRDLGIYLDADLSMRSHVGKTVSACFAVLRQLYGVSAGHFPDPFSSRWWHHSSCPVWTTAVQPWPVFRRTSFNSFSRWWTRPPGSCFPRRSLLTSLRFFSNCTGWEPQSELTSSWLFLYTIVCMEQHRHTSSTISAVRQILRPGDVYALLRFRHWLSHAHGCLPSQQLVFGTVFRNVSRQHRHWLFSGVAWRLTSSVILPLIHLTVTL